MALDTKPFDSTSPGPVRIAAGTTTFSDGSVLAAQPAEVKPMDRAGGDRSWNYLWATASGAVRVLVELPDGTQVEVATTKLELQKGQCGFIAIRSSVSIRPVSEMPKPEPEGGSA